MKLVACRKALNAHLRPMLIELGFSTYSLLSFKRSYSRGLEILRFPDRRDSERCLFSGNLGLSISMVEKIMRPDSKEILPTIWAPLHFLHADREFFEWTIREEGDVPYVASTIMEEVYRYALPFFEKYANIDLIKGNLESSTPRDWFALGPDQRICVLAALEYLAGNVSRSFQLLEDSIRTESTKPIPRGRPMKTLLTDLRGKEVL